MSESVEILEFKRVMTVSHFQTKSNGTLEICWCAERWMIKQEKVILYYSDW